MTTPRVSVIIATYNWSAVLPYSIGSALRQTLADIEVLVVGDNCTDDSEAVVAAMDDPRVRWINLPENTGHQSGPNNEGLRQARGDIIAYLGHDDLWLPHHLSLRVAAIDGGADLVYGITGMVKTDGAEALPYYPPAYYEGVWIPPTSVAHRRGVTERVGGWSHWRELNNDPESELWSRAHRSGARFVFIPRLTAIKFPAAFRRNIYKLRPCHEQRAWFARLGANADIEATELGRMVVSLHQEKELTPLGTLCRNFFAAALDRISGKLWWYRLRRYGYKRSVFDARRRFKGLDYKS